MQTVVGYAIETLVAALLVATIVYCGLLNRRLARFRADEAAMRQTIVELVAATHAAERAVASLRTTLGETEETLADRLGRAQQMSSAIAGQLGEGEQVLARLSELAREQAAQDYAAQERAAQEYAAQEYAAHEAAREIEAREQAERERARAAAYAAEAFAEPVWTEPAPAPLSRSAATLAAAELLTSRIRALSAGAAAA